MNAGNSLSVAAAQGTQGQGILHVCCHSGNTRAWHIACMLPLREHTAMECCLYAATQGTQGHGILPVCCHSGNTRPCHITCRLPLNESTIPTILHVNESMWIRVNMNECMYEYGRKRDYIYNLKKLGVTLVLTAKNYELPFVYKCAQLISYIGHCLDSV